MVLVRFPHSSGIRGKKRPAAIVQSDAYTTTVGMLVVAEATRNLAQANDSPVFSSLLLAIVAAVAQGDVHL